METKNTYYRVYANIDLDAIIENVKNAKKLVQNNAKFMAIIKADGYGHGAVEIAREINDLVDGYGVATIEEAVELRKAGFDKLILILGYVPEEQYNYAIKYDITMAMFSLDMAKKMNEAGKKLDKQVKIHIKLDTGMSRIGFALTDKSLSEIKEINSLKYISIDGCFSHFATMDEKDKTKAMEQFDKFKNFTDRLIKDGVALPVRHIANSAGIMEKGETHLDMVRDGICLYGLYPSTDVECDKLPLKPAMEVKARVSFVKELEKGISIGYGGTYTTTKRTVVATIPVGYADGYSRALSNKGCVLIKGQRAPIIGRICMDQFMVDVTDIEGVTPGMEVTLFGKDGEHFLSVEEVSDLAYSFNYEFVCDMGKRIPRVYFKSGKVISTRDYYPEM